MNYNLAHAVLTSRSLLPPHLPQPLLATVLSFYWINSLEFLIYVFICISVCDLVQLRQRLSVLRVILLFLVADVTLVAGWRHVFFIHQPVNPQTFAFAGSMSEGACKECACVHPEGGLPELLPAFYPAVLTYNPTNRLQGFPSSCRLPTNTF